MQIPDTPEALFEALAEPSLRELYPRFDDLRPRNQKIIRLIHTELTKGELTDGAFQQFIGFILVLWRSFNHSALVQNEIQIDTEDEIDTDWVEAAVHLNRMDQFLATMLCNLETMPSATEEGTEDEPNRYLLRGPGPS